MLMSGKVDLRQRCITRDSVTIIKLKFGKRKLEVKSYIPNNTASKHMNSFIIS